MAEFTSRQRPWFAFYPEHFLGATMSWPAEAIGCYIRLLSYQWLNGSIPTDQEELGFICPAIAKHWKRLSPKFPKGINPRLEVERDKMVEASEHARQAINTRWDRVREEKALSKDRVSDGYVPDGYSEDTPVSPDHTPVSIGHIPDGIPNDTTNTKTKTNTNTKDQDLHQDNKKERTSRTRSKKAPTRIIAPAVTTQMWDAFKKAYPERQGTQGWSKALKKAIGLCANGTEWSAIMEGARRYKKHQQATGNIGTQFVCQAETFLSPDGRLWEEDYPIPTESAIGQKNQATADRFVEDLEAGKIE